MSQNWKSTVVSINSTIRKALEVIDTAALRAALVVGDGDILLGVVTDGDVRRGLLKGISLESCVSEIMHTKPYTAELDTPKQQLINRMNELDILFIPLLDDGRLVGLETLHNVLFNTPKYNNPVFIMAGGFGTRLRPLTDDCPKPMLKIGDKPILEILIERFAKAGFYNIYISTHYLPDMITEYFGNGNRWGVNIQYVYEASPLGTGGALGLLPEEIADLPLIMINGDVLTTLDFERLLQYHTTNDSVATMCVRQYEYQIPYGVITGDGDVINEMVEKPIQSYFVNAGIYMLQPHLFKSVKKGQIIDMPTLLEQRIEQGETVRMLPIHEYWLDIGRMDDFNRAQVDIMSLRFE